MDYGALLSRIAAIPGYSSLAEEIISQGALKPTEGELEDPAHPAIYPTAGPQERPLSEEERRVFDLVVRRVLSCFGKEAVREESAVEISVGRHVFKLEETRVLAPGWMRFEVDWRAESRQSVTSMLRAGDRVDVVDVSAENRFRAPSARYNQATLLEKMEREGIGTKSTRADVISTLLDRGYVGGGRDLAPMELGLSVIEAMREYCPQIISTNLTRQMESQLERIETSGEGGEDLFEETAATLLRQVANVRAHGEDIGSRLRESTSERTTSQNVLGSCPVCKEGKLTIVRSSKSGKRFAGCTNYPSRCRASAPLPQRGVIRTTSRRCSSCGWPMVYVSTRRRPWKLCVNDRCPRKVNVFAIQEFRRIKKS